MSAIEYLPDLFFPLLILYDCGYCLEMLIRCFGFAGAEHFFIWAVTADIQIFGNIDLKTPNHIDQVSGQLFSQSVIFFRPFIFIFLHLININERCIKILPVFQFVRFSEAETDPVQITFFISGSVLHISCRIPDCTYAFIFSDQPASVRCIYMVFKAFMQCTFPHICRNKRNLQTSVIQHVTYPEIIFKVKNADTARYIAQKIFIFFRILFQFFFLHASVYK